jgi:hypothetical protein
MACEPKPAAMTIITVASLQGHHMIAAIRQR